MGTTSDKETAQNSPSGVGGIKAGIIGSAGYTGGELIRILLNHPNVELSLINSKSNAGKPIHAVHQDLLGDTDLIFSDDNVPLEKGAIDVLFLCVGHGESKKFIAENKIADSIKIIDLANDFRLYKDASYHVTANGDLKAINRDFVYGLPEINRDEIRIANNIANPGCFATAIQLGLLPLAKAGILKNIYTTGITGSTGAGQSLSQTSHFSWRANNIQAYKTLTHQHLGEIGQSLVQLQIKGKVDLSFVPWRGDFTRGIFISSQLDCDWKIEDLITLYQDFYSGHPFTFLSQEAIFLKQVVNTNKAVIQLEKVGTKLVIHSALDNLVKGASGQAVQNMNLMFGIDERAGLKLKATGF